jgi:ACS family pantothenate transporter-like MFS transporter
MTTKAEKKRVTEAQVEVGDEKNFEADTSANVKV